MLMNDTLKFYNINIRNNLKEWSEIIGGRAPNFWARIWGEPKFFRLQFGEGPNFLNLVNFYRPVKLQKSFEYSIATINRVNLNGQYLFTSKSQIALIVQPLYQIKFVLEQFS